MTPRLTDGEGVHAPGRAAQRTGDAGAPNPERGLAAHHDQQTGRAADHYEQQNQE
jgi:hypothetical protein